MWGYNLVYLTTKLLSIILNYSPIGLGYSLYKVI